MFDRKDWGYFQFKVGRYEPYYFASEEEKKKFVPYKPQNKKLEWFVFEEDSNAKEIVPLNVFEGSISFIYGLLEAKKKYKDNYLKFAEEVRSCLSYSYWGKCEWETIITGWPTFVNGEEIDRLSEEKQKHQNEHGYFYGTYVNLKTAYKMDVYTQVMMNWDRFIEYVWANKRLITKKKLGIEK